MNVDLKLIKDSQGNYDIGFQANGDFEIEEGFDTAILMSLFQNKRLDESEQPIPQYRGGWWGNILNDVVGYEIGSKLWALDGRRTQNTLNQAIDFARDCLQWFIDDGLLKDINVTGEMKTNGITLQIILTRFNNKSETKFFDLWENTDLT